MIEEDFKRAMSKLPSGVTVITATYDNEYYGFTANSFTSVSLSPPLILFCINKNAGSFNAFCEISKFAINILAENQQDISQHFASKILDKFANIEFSLGAKSNSPLLKGCIAFIECKKIESIDGGDHSIFIGQVESTMINNNLNPLLYYSRSYHKIK